MEYYDLQQDLSDELDDSPEERRVQLPGILEDASPAGTASSLDVTSTGLSTAVGGLQTPSTPRIDISRASSSSHHEEEGESGDSRGSTPERELFAGQGGLGFKVRFIHNKVFIMTCIFVYIYNTVYLRFINVIVVMVLILWF
jgi:hypothetical protein